MNAIILARVSTKEQEEGHSIDAQIARLQEYCQRKNLKVLNFQSRNFQSRSKKSHSNFAPWPDISYLHHLCTVKY